MEQIEHLEQRQEELFGELKDHMKKFLATTTAHGFNHLVEEEPRASKYERWATRAAWVCAIISAFTASAYYLAWSTVDVTQNPVATTVEYIPVQGIPFPAVTMAADVGSIDRLKSTILHQLDYDCLDIEDDEECMKRTSAARQVAQPAAKFLIQTMFDEYREFVIAEMKMPVKDLRRWTCDFTSPTGIVTVVFNKVMAALSFPKRSQRKQTEQMLLRHIADGFKKPTDLFIESMADLLQSYSHVNMTRSQCMTTHFDRFSIEAKAMFLLLVKVLDGTSLTMSFWNRISEDRLFDDSTQVAFQERFEELKLQVDEGMMSLVGERKFANIGQHLGLQGLDKIFGLETRESTVKNETGMHHSYKEILQVAKYSLVPLQSKMTEKARVRDLEHTLMKAINITYGRRNSNSFINYDPALLHCNFDKDQNEVCQTVMATFTKSGVGYSFNTENFFQLYQKKPTTETFCQEIVERTDQSMCSGKNNKKVLPIKSNGKRFALRLLLNTPRLSRHHWILQKLAVHSPYSIPDTLGDFFEPSPGTHTTVVLTPHVTRTDESLFNEDKSKRGCHHQEEDGNPLQLFAYYTKDNCIFECHLKRSTEMAGCVPWNYPKLEEEVRTCSLSEAYYFEEQFALAEKVANCSDCRDECLKYDYEYSIHTKPLKEMSDNDDIKGAVNMVVNDGQRNFLPDYYVVQELGLMYHMVGSTDSYVRQNTAVVDFYVGPANADTVTGRARITYLQQLANLGGMFALFTGVSALTLVGFLYWLLKLLWILAKILCVMIRIRWSRWRMRRRVAPLGMRRERLFMRVARRVRDGIRNEE